MGRGENVGLMKEGKRRLQISLSPRLSAPGRRAEVIEAERGFVPSRQRERERKAADPTHGERQSNLAVFIHHLRPDPTPPIGPRRLAPNRRS